MALTPTEVQTHVRLQASHHVNLALAYENDGAEAKIKIGALRAYTVREVINHLSKEGLQEVEKMLCERKNYVLLPHMIVKEYFQTTRVIDNDKRFKYDVREEYRASQLDVDKQALVDYYFPL